MAFTYYLACFDCKAALPVGRIIRPDEWETTQVDANRFGFSGFVSEKDSHRISDYELMELLTRFLIVHRVHEIRLLPETALSFVDVDSFGYVDYPEQITSIPIEPQLTNEENEGAGDIIWALARRLERSRDRE